MRIAIVNDIPLAVEALRRALALNQRHEVIWTAGNGAEAVALCARQLPDLVLMDLLMPVMDGVEATRRIMTESPCPILVVTVSVGGNAWRAFEAMGHGALDAVDTPTLGRDDDGASGAAALLAKIDTIERLVGEPGAGQIAAGGRRLAPAPASTRGPLLAIGASAGGPAALLTVLRGLPKDFPAAIVVIQHVDERFAAGMAEWLGQQCALPVRLAREGEHPVTGTVLIAGTNDHLTLTASERLSYTPEPREYVYRPSVDVFFHSLPRFWPGRAVGVLLTGMGRDGATGLKALRDHGWHTIAQDQASCAVFGMPKAAIALGAAVEVLPLARITSRLQDVFSGAIHTVNQQK